MFYTGYTYVMEITDVISANVKKYRKLSGKTQEKVAGDCGVTTHQIGEIEAGRRKPSIDLLFAIASSLKVDSSLLLEQGEVERPMPKLVPSEVLAMYSHVPDDIILRAQNHPVDSEVWGFVRTAFDEVEAHQARKSSGEKKNHA